jgi:hypothetical protein
VKDVKFAKPMNVSQKEYVRGQVQWLMPVIPEILKRQRQGASPFKVSLSKKLVKLTLWEM